MDIIRFYDLAALPSFILPVLFLINCIVVCCTKKSLKPIPIFLFGMILSARFFLQVIIFSLAYDDITDPSYTYFLDWTFKKAFADMLPTLFFSSIVCGFLWLTLNGKIKLHRWLNWKSMLFAVLLLLFILIILFSVTVVTS